MKYNSKVDDNQAEIVKAFRKAGASVKHVHSVKGFVDIVVGYCGCTELVEIKDGTKSPSKQKLTKDEQEFWDSWKGRSPVIVKGIGDIGLVLKNMVRGV